MSATMTMPTPATEISSVYFDARSYSTESMTHSNVNASSDTITPSATDPVPPGGFKLALSSEPNTDSYSGAKVLGDKKRSVPELPATAILTEKSGTLSANEQNFVHHDHPSPAYEETDPANKMFVAHTPGQINEGNNNATTEHVADVKSVPPRTQSPSTIEANAVASGHVAVPEPVTTAHQRSMTAETTLSNEAKAKITKEEVKNAKRLSKVVKAEGKTQKKQLDAAIKDFTRLQKSQKKAVLDEQKALSQHAKAVKYEHKMQVRMLAAKTKYEHAAADLRAHIERLDLSRAHTQKETEMLATKTRDLEDLRQQKGVDDREREVRLAQLADVGKN